jgi:hypothetical protein
LSSGIEERVALVVLGKMLEIGFFGGRARKGCREGNKSKKRERDKAAGRASNGLARRGGAPKRGTAPRGQKGARTSLSGISHTTTHKHNTHKPTHSQHPRDSLTPKPPLSRAPAKRHHTCFVSEQKERDTNHHGLLLRRAVLTLSPSGRRVRRGDGGHLLPVPLLLRMSQDVERNRPLRMNDAAVALARLLSPSSSHAFLDPHCIARHH